MSDYLYRKKQRKDKLENNEVGHLQRVVGGGMDWCGRDRKE